MTQETAAGGPHAKALAAGLPAAIVEIGPTDAYGVACPVGGHRGVVAVRDSGGEAVLVTDEETEEEKTRKEEKRDVVVFEEDDKVARLWTFDIETGHGRCLTHGRRHVWGFAW